ncbi:hypothetical protein AGLY_012796 [Aphis glycines]|uniref:Peptidase A2 domain-containing protein n=1 Tax=Aphis glycines TaxID=307491 RepID=A0A6G0TA93_APHGL|nr:hypothetical protein AGLY_012796 [Aphis glycines]
MQETKIRKFKAIRRISSYYLTKFKKLYTVECRRWAPGRKPENSRNLIRRNILNNTARQKIEQDHVQCQSPQTIPADSKFLIDSGGDLNLIKLSSMRDEVIVYDHTVYELKGITDNFVTTLGSVTIELQIGGEKRRVEFQVVKSDFPVPNEGILGKNHHQVFNLTAFKNQQGIYYESHGVARLSHVSWELVISLDVQLLISKYHVIMAHYQATTTICEKMKNRLGNVEIEEICSLFIQRFSRATLPYLNEIEANHISIMLAMNNDDNRIRRGLGQTFRRMANVLYGLCSKIDVEFIINQITELNRSKVPSKSNIPEKIRFLQAEVNHSTQQLELQQQKVEQNLQYLQAQANLNIQNLNKLAFRTKVLEQSLLFELVLSKYAYETQNLISIINSALDGKIPTSVFTPQHIIKELLEIKVDLPIGNTFPVEVNIESLNEILRISEKNIFFKDNYLIYVIEISLITSEEYSIYHPIPLPIPHSEQTIFLVDPEIDYLGVSRDNENFIALDNVKWEECITLKPYKVCRGNQHVQHCAESDVCVVSLLVNNQFNPDHCKVKFVSLKAPI